MKTLKVLTIVAITGLVGTVAANACPSTGTNKAQCQTNNQKKCQKGDYKKNKHNRSEMKEIFQQLDLSAEQKTALKSQRKVMREQMKDKRSKRHAKRGMANMSGFVSAEGFDKEAFIAKATEKSQTMIAMRANMFEQKMNILTEEQRVKLVRLLQEK